MVLTNQDGKLSSGLVLPFCCRCGTPCVFIYGVLGIPHCGKALGSIISAACLKKDHMMQDAYRTGRRASGCLGRGYVDWLTSTSSCLGLKRN